LLTCRKPIVVIHNSWMSNNDGTLGWENRVKRRLVRFTHNVSVSRAIAEALPVTSKIICNPFSTADFAGLKDEPKTKTLVFMGRLVSDKGVDTLLNALAELRRRGLAPDLTVIGDGSEMAALRSMTEKLGLTGQVTFMGALRETRGSVVAQHSILVVPSRWAEPFGIVALEGIASGCAVVASAQGGLSDAVGPCGLLFPNGDSIALADVLEKVLTNSPLLASLVAAGPEHLTAFTPEHIAGQYLSLFQILLSGKQQAGSLKAQTGSAPK
jgi:glycogen synthase